MYIHIHKTTNAYIHKDVCVCVCVCIYIYIYIYIYVWGFPDGADGEESTCNAGDPGLIPGLGRCPREGNSYNSSILPGIIP